MRKALFHFVVLAIGFFGAWFLLSRIDFVTRMKIPQFSKDNEKRIGDFILRSMNMTNQELAVDSAHVLAEKLKRRICTANGIDDASITLHLLKKDEVNAFALPGRHLVVYSGLIRRCRNPEELSGVLAHEIAHMERNHVMKKLVKEVGLSMVTTIAGGDSTGEIGRQTLTLLSSTAFDREQEKEADHTAVHMMAKSGIDPEHLANFLFRLSREEKSLLTRFEWLNTHPDSQNRASEILKLRKREKYSVSTIVGEEEWKSMLTSIDEDERSSISR
jgi:beta-barrel assembly-enhancing protease